MTSSTVDEENLREFTSRADQWWDLEGAFKPLHDLNPVRIDFILSEISKAFNLESKAFETLSILDVGCGGGLVTEPLARTGAVITGLDAGVENITVAESHAREEGLDIQYVCSPLESFFPDKLFDVVIALEIVEHVSCVDTFITNCFRVLKPNGIVIFSTLNRTAKSFVLGIVAAEYILRWVPRGTHSWEQFLKPSELARSARYAGGTPKTLKGMAYHPFLKRWSLSDNCEVNYFFVTQKK